jgi:8-oxo-dGTP pyrophosphatase MutT (NUDIX family)
LFAPTVHLLIFHFIKKSLNPWYNPSMPPETSNKDRKPTTREISAGIVVFRQTSEGPKFLILYHGGNYWNFPKGHIEKEEGDLEAALRETKEEAGLSPRDLRLVSNFKAYERFTFRRSGQSIYKIVIFYLAESRVREVAISDEHQGYGWFTFREANKILGRYRDSQKVLRQAFDFLRAPAAGPATTSASTAPTSQSSRAPQHTSRPHHHHRPQPHPAR